MVTVDIALREGSGLDLIRRIADQDPAIKMIACSLHDETLYAERALHAGAMGYVTKHEATQTIVKAIRQVLQRYPDRKAGVTLANSFPTMMFRPAFP